MMGSAQGNSNLRQEQGYWRPRHRSEADSMPPTSPRLEGEAGGLVRRQRIRPRRRRRRPRGPRGYRRQPHPGSPPRPGAVTAAFAPLAAGAMTTTAKRTCRIR